MMKQKELVPKIRFEGFDDDWKKLKFLEVVFRLSEKNMDGEIPRIEFEDINSGLGTLNKDINKKKSNKSGIKFNSGDILFGKLRPYLKNWLLADFEGIAVGDFWVFRSNNFKSELIYALIQGKKYQQIANLSIGTKMPRSDWEIVSNTQFLLPQKVKEQQKIGQFFKHLDEMIVLQQRKMAKTKALKAAYLAEMFPAEGERVPKRRFEEFSDDFKKYTLSNITDVYDGTHQTPKYTDEGIMFLSVENIECLESDKFISQEDFERDFKNFPEKDDILMTRIGSIGKVNVIETNQKLAYYVSLALLKTKDVFPEFLVACISSPPVKRELWKRTLHIAFPKKINKNEIENVELNIPSFAEQQKIGQFFKRLDDTISIHQQKLEKLKATKQAYLHEMFV